MVKQIESLERGKCHIKITTTEEVVPLQNEDEYEDVPKPSKSLSQVTYDSDGENVEVSKDDEPAEPEEPKKKPKKTTKKN